MGPLRSAGVRRAAAVMATSVAVALSPLPAAANPQGAPSLSADGQWTSGEYVEAIFAVHNGAITLPRLGNPKTQAYFDRLIDRRNIESLMASPLAQAEKRRQILTILSATGEFRGRYGYAVALGDDVQNELTQIQIFRLYLIDRLAALDLSDASAGKCCSSAIATTLQGTLDTLAEAPAFTSDQLIALAQALARHYPMIRTHLSAEDHMAIRGRLERMTRAESDPGLKTAFAAALAAARSGN
ncbi:hypothetical protein [Taklimakanibacter lacteus]|uniref:hypothetical protein n=1 Tax=Taklimakanibacter lacteus TaxID=2268456 RepID=UPI0013C4C97D